MKIIDKYVAKNFLIGYLISFLVLIGMRIIIDLFVNIDEFIDIISKHEQMGSFDLILTIFRYYGFQSALYFRDFAGMITVVASVFSLAKMTRNNELIAVMASGMSLKRVIAPIIVLATCLTGLLIVDQEYIIPNIADKLVRAHDELPGEETYPIRFMSDKNGSLISARNYIEKDEVLIEPTIILREKDENDQFQVIGPIWANRAHYDYDKKVWNIEKGNLFTIQRDVSEQVRFYKPKKISTYKTDIVPSEIPQRRKQLYKSLLSFTQLLRAKNEGMFGKDVAELYSQIHFRITDPLINMTMLLIALPILVCREPKAMKSAIALSFSLTLGCLVFTFICKMAATEVIFNSVRPELWAWAPICIFFPIACAELESMKT